VTFDLQQVENIQRSALRGSLLSALQKFAAGPRVVLIQICLSLAGLALQMPDWDDPVAEIIQALGHNPQLVPSLLQFLTVLPEEVTSNSRIPLSVSWISHHLSTRKDFDAQPHRNHYV
jgi:transportin-3